MNRIAFAAVLLLTFACAPRAHGETLVQEAIINAPTPEVWRLFTTSEGLTSWMVARADIDEPCTMNTTGRAGSPARWAPRRLRKQ